VPHYFNYELMKQLNGGKQMKDVWKLPAVAPRKTIIFAFQKSNKQLSLLFASRQSRIW
jgi:hypothetical protein